MESTERKCLFLFWTFFKAMMFAFTNGAVALPAIERGIVDKKRWLTHEEFWTYPVLGQTLPGVISIHNAILIGNRIAGAAGAFSALMGVIIPAFVCMLGIAALFQAYVDDPLIQGAIRGIRVVSVAIILGNAVRILKTVPTQAFSIVMVLAAVLIPLMTGFGAFRTIIACGIAGILSVLFMPLAPDNNQTHLNENGE